MIDLVELFDRYCGLGCDCPRCRNARYDNSEMRLGLMDRSEACMIAEDLGTKYIQTMDSKNRVVKSMSVRECDSETRTHLIIDLTLYHGKTSAGSIAINSHLDSMENPVLIEICYVPVETIDIHAAAMMQMIEPEDFIVKVHRIHDRLHSVTVPFFFPNEGNLN